MIIKKPVAYTLLYTIAVAFFVMYVNPYDVNGDQYYYRELYNSCFFDPSFDDQWQCYVDNTGSAEPVYFYIVKFAQHFLSKDVFVVIADSVLAFAMVSLVFRYYKNCWHRHLFIVLLLTNYYAIVLFFAAERLKFGFVFLLLGLLAQTQLRRIPLVLLAMITHTQMSMMVAPYFVSRAFRMQGGFLKKAAVVTLPLLLFGVMYFFLKGHIESKLVALNNSDIGFGATLKILFFLVIAGVSVRRFEPIVAGLPLLFSAYYFGSDRVAILAFILYMAYVIAYKKRMDALLVLFMLYFSFKSIDFVSNIIVYGNGYYG